MAETGKLQILKTNWNQAQTFADAQLLCDSKGGQIPVPKTSEDNHKLFILSGIIQTYEQHQIPTNKEVYWQPKVDVNGFPPEKTFFFWLGIERDPLTMKWNNIYTGEELTWTNWLLHYQENNQNVVFPRFYNSMYAVNMTDDAYGGSQMKLRMGDQETENTCICQSFNLEKVHKDCVPTSVRPYPQRTMIRNLF